MSMWVWVFISALTLHNDAPYLSPKVGVGMTFLVWEDLSHADTS